MISLILQPPSFQTPLNRKLVLGSHYLNQTLGFWLLYTVTSEENLLFHQETVGYKVLEAILATKLGIELGFSGRFVLVSWALLRFVTLLNDSLKIVHWDNCPQTISIAWGTEENVDYFSRLSLVSGHMKAGSGPDLPVCSGSEASAHPSLQ